MNKIEFFLHEFFNDTNYHINQLPKSGSERTNFIVTHSGQEFVLTENDNIKENESFFYFSEIFAEENLNTPKILKISADKKMYLQQYVGYQTLLSEIEKEHLSDSLFSLIDKTIDNLFDLQVKMIGKVDFSKSFEYETYDELPITHDLYYFKNYLIDVLEIHYSKSALLKDFKKISKKIETLEPKGIMIRDFQSRNIMINKNKEVYFIDYQSAMNGPLLYDIVSFLYQAKAQFSSEWKTHFENKYLDFWKDKYSNPQLQEALNYCKFIRFVQVLGAYSFRGLIQRKAHFLESLFLGLNNLIDFSQNWSEMEHYPEFENLIEKLKTEEIQTKLKTLINEKK